MTTSRLVDALRRWWVRPTVEPSSHSPVADHLTEEHVIWGYRLFLDREPENQDVVRGKLEHQSNTMGLRLDFISSYEFRLHNPELGYITKQNIVIKEIANGQRLFIDLADHWIGLSVARGDYEVNEVAYVRSVVQPGQAVLDIGANIGYISMVLGNLVGPMGRVHAFEPVDGNATLLARSITENQLEDVVELTRAAVGEQSGISNMVVATNSMNSGGSFLDAGGGEMPGGHHRESIPVVALDDQQLRRPISFVKIDVEGAEPLALRGARRLLTEDRPIILCEINAPQLRLVSGCTPTEFISEVEAIGYRCQLLDGMTTRPDDGDLNRPGIRSVVFTPA